MRPTLSTMEKLKVYYVELDSLEAQLRTELATEALSKYRGGLKKSRSTKYKITVYKRAISQMEKLVNAKAIVYSNWKHTKMEIERELELKSIERDDLALSAALLEAEVNNASGLNFATVTAKAMEFSKISLDLAAAKKRVAELKTELERHLKKMPSYANEISKAKIFEDMEIEDSITSIPEALGGIVRAAREKTPQELEVESFLSRPVEKSDTDYVPLKTTADTDVSALRDLMYLMGDSNVNTTNDEIPHQDACEDNAVESDNKDSNLHSS